MECMDCCFVAIGSPRHPTVLQFFAVLLKVDQDGCRGNQGIWVGRTHHEIQSIMSWDNKSGLNVCFTSRHTIGWSVGSMPSNMALSRFYCFTKLCLLQARNRSAVVYERVREITKDRDKHFFTFSNEFCKYDYLLIVQASVCHLSVYSIVL